MFLIRHRHDHFHHDDPQAEARLRSMDDKLGLIITNQEAIMAAIDNLNSDIDTLSTAITAYATAVTAALAAAQAASQDPAIDAADAKVRAATKALSDDLAALNTPVTVPTPPPA